MEATSTSLTAAVEVQLNLPPLHIAKSQKGVLLLMVDLGSVDGKGCFTLEVST